MCDKSLAGSNHTAQWFVLYMSWSRKAVIINNYFVKVIFENSRNILIMLSTKLVLVWCNVCLWCWHQRWGKPHHFCESANIHAIGQPHTSLLHEELLITVYEHKAAQYSPCSMVSGCHTQLYSYKSPFDISSDNTYDKRTVAGNC